MSENPYENYYSGKPEQHKYNPTDMNEESPSSEYSADNQPVKDESASAQDVPEYSFDSSTQPLDECFTPDPLGAEPVPAAPFSAAEVTSQRVPEYTYGGQQESATAGDASPVISSGSYEWHGDSVAIDTTPAVPSSENVPYKESNDKPHSKKGRMSLAAILIVCILISAIAGGGSAYLVNSFFGNNTSNSSGLTINKVTSESNGTSYDPSSELSTVDIVDKYADSVVEIITEYVETGVFAQQYIQSGAGSGVIIDSNGYIVTNHHVIDGAEKISVTLRSGESFNAQLIGSDSKMDIALLKIDASGLTAAVFGDSDNLKVGQRTIAIGNPLGQLGGTVTEGIISALDRDVVVDGQTMNLLQTDTAINPGNSGGGMFDGNGNLIGIVVAKSSGSEVEGLGFAIPVNDAIDILADLMDYGYVRGRIAIGMEFIDVSSVQVAWMYGLSDTGCYVYSVDKNSNAEEAGFKSGDLILSVDGEEVATSDDIESVLEQKNVGDSVVFELKRGVSKGSVTLVLEEYVPETLQNNDSEDDYIEWYNYG